MRPNLWMYSTDEDMRGIAASLMIFGASVFKSAKIVREIDLLNQLCIGRSKGTIAPNDQRISDFFFEYLTDCIKIVIFFENYMKAELIASGYCVHQIKKDYPNFESLAKDQQKRPVLIREIHDIEPFQVDEANKIMLHPAIKENTIGFGDLTNKPAYTSKYRFDETTLNHIKKMNFKRNSLHFHDSIEFELSSILIDEIRNMNSFVDLVVNSFIIHPANQ